MKQSLFLFVVLILACNQADNKNMAFLDNGIMNCNEAIRIRNDKLFTDILAADIENPAKNRHFRFKTDSLRLISENIHHLIKIAISDNWSDTCSKKNFDSNLVSLFEQYKTHLNDFPLQDTILLNKSLFLENNKYVNISKLNKSKLLLLENKIRGLNNYILSYYTDKMEQPRFRSDKIEVAVIPKSKYLSSKDMFEAEMYLVSFDSKALNISVFIEGNEVEIIDGKAIYIDTATNTPGLIKKEGLLIFKRPDSDFSKDFPFSITYQIREK
jgi:hypothetical protein